MKGVLWLIRFLTRRVSPQNLLAVAAEIWPSVWQRIPEEERVDFLTKAVEDYLGHFLAGLNHEERVRLMNGLLPIAAREFPLAEINFLDAFAKPGIRYHPQNPR